MPAVLLSHITMVILVIQLHAPTKKDVAKKQEEGKKYVVILEKLKS